MQIFDYKPGESSRALERIRSRAFQASPELIARVGAIIEGVRAGGDEALIHYTKQLDHVELGPAEIRVSQSDLSAMAARANRERTNAFLKAIANVRRFHELERESGWMIEPEPGCATGLRILPVASAGLYVPGGKAAYPSSIIMNAVPAQVAGVPRLAVATPPGTIERTPEVAAVLIELGVREVYRIGGAQAIAALAFGTETVPRVDKITGPGNIYVAIAKKLVFGSVGIDSVAGPTEIVVLADESANPKFAAADLLAQAEHDEEASAICITTSARFALGVAAEVERQLATLDRRAIAGASIEKYGAVFVVDSIEAGCELINQIAPEHLELMTDDNERAASMVENAGAIFFGDWASEPIGDYLAGPNHVLPTLGTSRFSSPLGVYDFVKRQSIINYSRAAIEANAPAIAAMADAEGLTGHKRAVEIRIETRVTSNGPKVIDQELKAGSQQSEVRDRKPADGCGQGPIGKIKPAVRAINAYKLTPHRSSIKVNQNENPFDMPLEIKREVERRLATRPWSRYPDFIPASLLKALATFAGWIPEGTLAGNGSNELIQAVLAVIVGPGVKVIIPQPTFTLYSQIVTVFGGEPIGVPLTRELSFDVAAIAEQALKTKADLMILCSPNNPTGCCIAEDDLVNLATNFDGIVVVDEAYHEFSGHTAAPLLEKLSNLIVLRTFSKAMSMAGLRVGYMLSSPELTSEVHKATLPYNLNFFSATAAEVACGRYGLLKPRIELIIAERERMFAALSALPGLTPLQSEANFFLVRSAIDPRTVFEELLGRDILVRDVSRYPMLSDCFRLSVGSLEENDRVISALSEIMAGKPA
jgi:histidinol dehydrogenase